MKKLTMVSKRQREAQQSTNETTPQRKKGINTNPYDITEETQVARYEILLTREVIATRYYDEHVLDYLGLLDDVYWMFDRVGIQNFVDIRYGTYRDITLEFLSTLHVELTQGARCEEGCISFRMMGVHHELTLDEFNEIYGFSKSLGMHARRIPSHYNSHAFWGLLTGEGCFQPSSAKATRIRNPCLRYAHRVLSNGMFGRDDSGNVVRATELYFLWAMLNDHHLDPGFYLANQFLHVANQSGGKIVIGGLITPIAMAFGFDPDNNKGQRVDGTERLDFDALVQMHMIRKRAGKYFWVYPSGTLLSLPDPDNTSVRDPNNLAFDAGHGDASIIPPPRPVNQLSPCEPSSSRPVEVIDYGEVSASLRALHEEQREQRKILSNVNTYLHQMSDTLIAWREWFVAQGFKHPPPNPTLSPPTPPHH